MKMLNAASRVDSRSRSVRTTNAAHAAQFPFAAEAEDLSRRTSFEIGGPAELFFEPASRFELVRTARRCRRAGLPVRAFGMGTNLLVGDGGVGGAVIATSRLQNIRADGGIMAADCGAGLPQLIAFAADRGLSGLEPLVGIPGSLGGAIKMNAGTASGCIADIVEELTLLTPEGDVFPVSRDEAGFGYRRSGLGDAIVLSARLKLRPSDRERIRRSVRARWQNKLATQPVNQPSAGCVFKNPPGDRAGRMLDRLGLRGAAAGGAKISEKHANFIVNCNRATAADVMALIRRAREAAFAALGITLELEIELW